MWSHQIISTPEEFERLEPIWSQVWSHSHLLGKPFWHFDWIRAWVRHFAANQLFIVVVFEHEEPIAILPLVRKPMGSFRLAPLRVLAFMGQGYITVYNDVMVSDIARQPMLAVDYLMRLLRRQCLRGYVAQLHNVPEDSTLWRYLRAHPSRWSLDGQPGEMCLELPLDGEVYVRGEIARKLRRVARQGPLHLVEVQEQESIQQFLDGLVATHRLTWSHAASDRFLDPRYTGVLRDGLPPLVAQGVVNLTWLRQGSATLGWHVEFRDERRAYGFAHAYNPAFRSMSPGKLMVCQLLLRAQPLVDVYDFLHGEDAYKFDWKPRARRNWEFQLHSPAYGAVRQVLQSVRAWRNHGRHHRIKAL